MNIERKYCVILNVCGVCVLRMTGNVDQKRRTYRFIILKEKSLHLASVAHPWTKDRISKPENPKEIAKKQNCTRDLGYRVQKNKEESLCETSKPSLHC